MSEINLSNDEEIIYKSIEKKIIKRNKILFTSKQEFEGEIIYYKLFPQIINDIYCVNNSKTTYFTYYKKNEDIHFVAGSKLCSLFKKLSVLPLTNINNCNNVDVINYLSSLEKTKINCETKSDIINFKKECYFIELTPILIIKDKKYNIKDVLIIPFLDTNLKNVLIKYEYFQIVYKLNIYNISELNDTIEYTETKKDDVFTKLETDNDTKIFDKKEKKLKTKNKKQNRKLRNKLKINDNTTDEETVNDELADERNNNINNGFDTTDNKNIDNLSDSTDERTDEELNDENINNLDNCSDTTDEELTNEKNNNELINTTSNILTENTLKINYIKCSFNSNITFINNEKNIIIDSLNYLYNNNNNFKIMFDNYNFVFVTKKIHADKFYNKWFTGYLFNTETKVKSEKLHFFLNEENIIRQITVINNLI